MWDERHDADEVGVAAGVRNVAVEVEVGPRAAAPAQRG